MILREYKASDRQALVEIQSRRDLPVEFPPQTESPLMLVKLVLANDVDNPVAAIFGTMTADMHFIMDNKAGTPRERWDWLRLLAGTAEMRLWQAGLESAVASVPVEIARTFGRRLGKLGFEREHFAVFRRRCSEPLEWLAT